MAHDEIITQARLAVRFRNMTDEELAREVHNWGIAPQPLLEEIKNRWLGRYDRRNKHPIPQREADDSRGRDGLQP